jgi:hypothetical protein
MRFIPSERDASWVIVSLIVAKPDKCYIIFDRFLGISMAGNKYREPARDQLNVGSLTRSFSGTDSTGSPALRQAVRPPTITNVLNPFSRSKCATRALVASRTQVQ